MKKILHVVGTRPNFVKAAPLINKISETLNVKQYLVHTGQHFDKLMSDSFFKSLNMSRPDIQFKIEGKSHAEQTAFILVEMEKVLIRYNPDMLIVYGDVNSTLSAALAAVKLNIPIAHIEAGLRSYDNTMPEEINRLLVDSISTYYFITERSGIFNLDYAGVLHSKMFFVGNLMIDSLSKVVDKIGLVEKNNKILITFHRPSNVDNIDGLRNIINIINGLTNENFLFPMHPRTLNNFKKFGVYDELKKLKNLDIIKPNDYYEFITNMMKSKCVITDSGGIQEETTYLKIPCLTLRDNTERPVTTVDGTNTLVTGLEDIKECVDNINNRRNEKIKNIYLWDGKTSDRICDVLNNILKLEN